MSEIDTVIKPRRTTEELYYELIYGVSVKFPNETRHETALRYIRESDPSTSSLQRSNLKWADAYLDDPRHGQGSKGEH